MIIYKVTNKINNKVYIGKTILSLEDRKRSHYKKAKLKSNSIFHKALKKYSDNDFFWEEVCKAHSTTELNELEKFYIKSYKSNIVGYNMTEGGTGGDTISMKTKKEKKKQGAKKGNVPWNKGISVKALGYPTKEWASKKPRTFTDEQRILHSKKIKKSKKYREGLKNRKPSKQIIIKDDIGNVWNTQKDLILHLNISHHQVRAGLKNKIWEYNGRKYSVVSKKGKGV